MTRRAEPRRLRLVAQDGVELAADEILGREPALLFLHGLASTRAGEKSASLLRWAQHDQRRLVRLDFRGHGESAGRLQHLTLTGLIADAQAALDHLGRAVVVGSSLGGLVGAWLATREPQRVAGLVLLAPAFGFLQRMAARPRVAGQVCVESPWTRVAIDEAVLDDARAWPEDQLAARLATPTLIVHGTQDEVVPASESERVFAGIPHRQKELLLVPDSHRLIGQIELVWPLMAHFLGEAFAPTA